MIFATDLDRTMIYSNKFLNDDNKKDAVLVEVLDGKEISYMSKSALKNLEELNKKIFVIPVTTRSIQQFSRINTFKYCKYAITTNGGTILHNGSILEDWEKHILNILEPYKDKMNYMMDLIKTQETITREPTLVDGKFIFTKTDNVQKCEEILEKIVDINEWNYTIQSQKVYIIPKEITKSNALKYLKTMLNEKEIIAAGDGKMDKDMLDVADIAILPEHGELYFKNNYKKENLIVVKEGILAADRIIKKVNEIYEGGIKYAI